MANDPTACGVEVLLYDASRQPPSWTDLIRPNQCAVFLRDARTSVPCRSDGTPTPVDSAYTCVLFDSIDRAQRFCEERVARLPHLCCDVFDADGRTNPPLMTITHADLDRTATPVPRVSQGRRIAAILLFAAAVPLIWIDVRHDLLLVLPMLLAINCVVVALRLLHWDAGARNQEQSRQARLAAHRERERRG